MISTHFIQSIVQSLLAVLGARWTYYISSYKGEQLYGLIYGTNAKRIRFLFEPESGDVLTHTYSYGLPIQPAHRLTSIGDPDLVEKIKTASQIELGPWIRHFNPPP